MFGIGTSELVIIIVVALIVVGPRRLPEIARALGRAYREFENSLSEVTRSFRELEEEEEKKEDEAQPRTAPGGSQPDDLSRTS